jgi:hypothetical protein
MPMDGADARGMAIRVGHMPGVVVRDGAIAAAMATDTVLCAEAIMRLPRFMADIMQPRPITVVGSTVAPSMAEADFMAAASAAAIGKNFEDNSDRMR